MPITPQAPAVLTPYSFALAIARANKHGDPESWAALVAKAHETDASPFPPEPVVEEPSA